MQRLYDLPHRDARRLLSGGAPVFLTVNPVEYHGPHLSLHNDRLVSTGLAKDVHARLLANHPDWPLIFASDLEVGVDPCWGAGSRHSRFAQVRALVCEACRALAELGAQRVVLMTFHGAPLHNVALEAGVRLLAARGVAAVAPFSGVLAVLVQPGPDHRQKFAAGLSHIEDAAEREQMIADIGLDFHAGFFETSVAMHYAPESVSPAHRALPPCPPFPPSWQSRVFTGLAGLVQSAGRDALAADLRFAAMALGWHQLRPFPGYTGRPHRASAASGAIFARLLVEEMAPLVDDVLMGRAQSPPPILGWLEAVTLGGRIGGVRVLPEHLPGRSEPA